MGDDVPPPQTRTGGEPDVDGLDLVAHGLHGVVHGEGRPEERARDVKVPMTAMEAKAGVGWTDVRSIGIKAVTG